MSKISEAFQNKKAFVGFLTAGDPSLDKTAEYIMTMEKAGASVIEIGVPFSDPIAESPVVQEANVRALSAEGSLEQSTGNPIISTSTKGSMIYKKIKSVSYYH